MTKNSLDKIFDTAFQEVKGEEPKQEGQKQVEETKPGTQPKAEVPKEQPEKKEEVVERKEEEVKPEEEKSVEFDFKSRFGRDEKEIESVLSQFEENRNALDALKKKFIENENPYPSESMRNAALLVKEKNIDERLAYELATKTQSDVDQMDDKEVLLMEKLINTPSLSEDRRAVLEAIEDDYFPEELSDDDPDATEEDIRRSKRDVRSASVRRKEAVEKAKTRIKDILIFEQKQGSIDPDQVIQQSAATKKDLEGKWGQAIPALVNEQLKTLSIKDADGNEVLQFEVPGEVREKLAPLLAAQAVNTGMELNEGNYKAIAQQYEAAVYINSFPKIVSAIRGNLEGSAQEKAIREVSNPSSGQPHPTKPAADTETFDQQMAKNEEKLFGRRTGGNRHQWRK